MKRIFFLKNKAAIAIVIFFYLGLVFYNFFSQGLVNWDEAYFLATIKTFTNVIKITLADPIGLFTNGAIFNSLLAGYNNVYTVARPSYILPAVLINLIFASEYSTRLVSIFSGLAILIFFYRLLAFFNISREIKITSIFLLAISPLFLIYSRLGLSQIFSAAFFLIASFYLLRFYSEKKNSDLVKSSLALAILMMSHYNSLPLVGLLFTGGFLIIFRQRQNFKKYLIFTFSFLTLPATWEIITRFGSFLATAKNIAGQENGIKVLSYFQEIINQLHKASGGNFSFSEFFYYEKLIFSTDGILISLLILAGIISAMINIKKIKYWPFLILPIIHLLLFSFVPLKFPRNIITVLPALYIFVALGLSFLNSCLPIKIKSSWKITALISVCFLILIINFGDYKNILNVKTNFRETAAFIKKVYSPEDVVIFAGSFPVWRVYLSEYKTENPSNINNAAFAAPGKKIIFISDFYLTAVGAKKYPNGFSGRSINEITGGNIFLVKPIILDFVCQSEEKNKKMFSENHDAPITIYELSRP